MNPLEARRRLLGRNVYKRTTEGNPAIAQGSLARMYPGITMQGWTEQAQTTGINMYNNDISDYRKLADYYTFNLPLKQGKYIIKARKKGVNVLGAAVGCTESGESYQEFVNQKNCIAIDGKAREILFTLTEDKNDFKYDGTEEWAINMNYENVFRHSEQNMQANSEVYSNSYKQILVGLLNESDYGISTGAYINIKNKNATTIEEFKTLLQSNPITVLYQLAEPAFVPLSETEQNQMNSLHTNRPTTVLSNDCECSMSLTYKTKKSMGGVIS